MNKKTYKTPKMMSCQVETQQFLAASQLNSSANIQQVTPTNTEYSGPFQ